jgi:hypothetical protein
MVLYGLSRVLRASGAFDVNLAVAHHPVVEMHPIAGGVKESK